MAYTNTILIVEDDADTAEMMVCILQYIGGYEVVRADSISSARSLIRDSRFSLIVLDVFLPDGSGIDLCRWIRSFDSETPLVFYSAVPGFLEEQAIAAGANAFVRKTGDIDVLQETVRSLMPDSVMQA